MSLHLNAFLFLVYTYMWLLIHSLPLGGLLASCPLPLGAFGVVCAGRVQVNGVSNEYVTVNCKC